MTATTDPERRRGRSRAAVGLGRRALGGRRSLERLLRSEDTPRGGFSLYPGLRQMFLFIVQAVTGIFLAMYYSPSPDRAYDSIQFIMNEVPFGAVVRGIHHWGASAMVVAVVAHMAVVFALGRLQVSARADLDGGCGAPR